MEKQVFQVKSKEQFETIKSREDAVPVKNDSELVALLEKGQFVYLSMDDGYGYFNAKKSYGMNKKLKTEIYMLVYEHGVPNVFESKDKKKTVKAFNDLLGGGAEFFYIPGEIPGQELLPEN